MKSFLDRFSAAASPKESSSVIAPAPEDDTSETASEIFALTTPSGPAASSGSDISDDTPQPAPVEVKYSRTSAISRLEEALTRTALTWSEMLGDPNVDAKTKVEMFKLASDHLSKMRRAGGDGEDDDTKSKLPGIEALRELMEGTAKKVVHLEMDDLIDEHSILTLPVLRPQGGRPTEKEQRRRARLAEAGLKHVQPAVHRRSKSAGGDDSGLSKLLNGKIK